ncbi:hypothetical protein [Ornithinimicrobium kibberense]|uniref:hypothetical protein n=1 Tax=Ornithinimicrobium kibberense TaxID=282060 RepID=UPI00361E579E
MPAPLPVDQLQGPLVGHLLDRGERDRGVGDQVAQHDAVLVQPDRGPQEQHPAEGAQPDHERDGRQQTGPVPGDDVHDRERRQHARTDHEHPAHQPGRHRAVDPQRRAGQPPRPLSRPARGVRGRGVGRRGGAHADRV